MVFASRDPPGYVLKNLDRDILVQRETLCSISRQITTMAVRVLRSKVRGVNDLLSPFKCNRATQHFLVQSGPSHYLLLVGVDIDDSKDSQREIYQKAVINLGCIHDSNLFRTQSVMPVMVVGLAGSRMTFSNYL